MSETIKNILISIISGTISGVIAGVIIDYLRKDKSIKLNRSGKAAIIVSLIIVFFIALTFLINPPDATIRITAINDKPVSEITSSDITIGYRLIVKGNSSKSGTKIYMVVKPLNDRFWYIQPPAPVQSASADGLEWAGQAYIGERDRGIGEDFLIFAITSSENYQPEQKLSYEPTGNKSNIVQLRRFK